MPCLAAGDLIERANATMPTFGEYLRQWRTEAGLSLRALGEKANVSSTYIDIIEKNKPHPISNALPKPTREKVIALADALGVGHELALRAAGYTDAPADPNAVVLPPLVKGATFISPERGVYICDGKSWVLQTIGEEMQDVLQKQHELIVRLNSLLARAEAGGQPP